MSERRSVDVAIGAPMSRDEQEACVAAVGFKCDLLWAQLDALQNAYVEEGHTSRQERSFHRSNKHEVRRTGVIGRA